MDKNSIKKRTITFRKAMAKDCNFYFAVANDLLSRANSFHAQPIAYEDHVQWFQKKISDPRTKMYVLEYGGEAAGQIRFDCSSSGECEVDVGIHPNFRNKGVAKTGLLEVSRFVLGSDDVKKIIARVKRENEFSQRAFISAGFSVLREDVLHGEPVVTMNLKKTEGGEIKSGK